MKHPIETVSEDVANAITRMINEAGRIREETGISLADQTVAAVHVLAVHLAGFSQQDPDALADLIRTISAQLDDLSRRYHRFHVAPETH